MSLITHGAVPVPSGLEWLRAPIASRQGPLLVALIYFLGAEAAFYIGTLSDRIFALFWPPNVVLFCALLIVPRRRWWLYIAAAFPAHMIAELGVGMPMAQLLVAFATNCMVALLNAYGVHRFVGDPPWFGTLQKAALYILVAAAVSPGLSALGGAFVPILGGGPLSNYWIYWAHWYVANALPNLTIGPAVVKALRPHTQKPFDVHLMISPVDPFLDAFAEAGADIITVHPEAGPHHQRGSPSMRASASASQPRKSGQPSTARFFPSCSLRRCRSYFGRRCDTAKRERAARSSS